MPASLQSCQVDKQSKKNQSPPTLDGHLSIKKKEQEHEYLSRDEEVKKFKKMCVRQQITQAHVQPVVHVILYIIIKCLQL